MKLPKIQKEIILVNDGSTDETAGLLGKLKIRHCRILHHPRNRGKGAAIRSAMPYSKGDFVIIQDADLEYDPADYQKLLNPLLNGSADVVYGSRFMGIPQYISKWFYIGNKFLTWFANLLYGSHLTDMETGYKAFLGPVFRGLSLKANRFNFDPEVTAKGLKKKFRFTEVPIYYRGRNFKDGKKINWWDGCMAVFCLVRFLFMD